MAGRLQIELACGSQVEQPRRQHAVIDQIAPFVGDALCIEGFGALAARAVRIVHHGDAVGEDLGVQAVFQEAGAAGDGRTGDGAGHMPDQPAGDARVIDHWNLGGGHAPRAQPGDSAFARACADGRRVFHIGAIDGMGEVVLGFHACAFPRNHRDADPAIGAGVLAREAVGGGQRDGRVAPARLRPVGIGHTRDRTRGVLAGARHLDESLARRLVRVFHV